MISAIIAIMPKDVSDMTPKQQERFTVLSYCYGGRRVPVRGVDFKSLEFLVDFHYYEEDHRWQIVDRLAKHLPIYKGLTTTRIYQAGMDHQLKISLEGFTLLTVNPIPEAFLKNATA